MDDNKRADEQKRKGESRLGYKSESFILNRISPFVKCIIKNNKIGYTPQIIKETFIKLLFINKLEKSKKQYKEGKKT